MQKKIISLIFAIMLLVSVFTLADLSMPVYAEEITVYSTAEEDLSKADNFNIEDYESRVNDSDRSIELIQIAVSEDNELFVYVFVPCSEVVVSSINFHKGKEDWEYSYRNYKLEPIDTDSYLHKYLVVRSNLPLINPLYINISSIYRYALDVDVQEGSSSTINEVAYKVGKIYNIKRLVSGVEYYCIESDVVEITARVDGFMRYWEGFSLFDTTNYIDSFFVAFSTDRNIDELYQADVEFITQRWNHYIDQFNDSLSRLEKADDEIKRFVEICPEEVEFNPHWFAKKRSWNRISTVSDFIANEDLTDEMLSELSGMQYVLRYYEDDFAYWRGGEDTRYDYMGYTEVSDVTILRLKFLSEGITYDLGVIDNKVTLDNVPDNNDVNSGFLGSVFDKLDVLFFKGNSSNKGFLSNLFGNKESSLFSKIITVIFSIFMLVLLVVILFYLTKLIIQLFKRIGKNRKKKGKKNEK